MTYVPESGEVIYRSKRNHATQRDLDGFVYEPEPWELARQQRLNRHAQQREFDQRPPDELNPSDHRENPSPRGQHERAWDPCAQQWQDTPLAKWARCAAQITVWDNIDGIPPEDEPVFFTD